MLCELEKKVAAFIAANGLFDAADKILLAVSGGADSTALLHIMAALKADGIINGQLICIHFNHKLRGQFSDRDQDFVGRQALELNVPVIIETIDVIDYADRAKLSIETAARNLRLRILQRTAVGNDIRYTATGHHIDDNAETIIQRLSRGTAIRGLCGIWPRYKFSDKMCLVRPLLSTGRQEIVDYLREKNISWQTDHTNADCQYRRNFIRHKLLPLLQSRSGDSIAEQLFDLSQSARKFHLQTCNIADKLQGRVVNHDGGELSINIDNFLNLHPAVKVELVRRALVELGSGERDLTGKHFERILSLAEGKASGKKIELPCGVTVQREYGRLLFSCGGEDSAGDFENTEQVQLEIPGRSKFGGYCVDAEIIEAVKFDLEKFKAGKTEFDECFDADKIALPVTIRFRKAGDRFIPLGLGCEKKVARFLIDKKIEHKMRKEVFIVCDAEKIIWLWPIRVSEQVKISDKTRKILHLQIAE